MAILLCAVDSIHAQYGYETLTVDNGLPEKVKVTVKRVADSITLAIGDNGRGFVPEARGPHSLRSGFGLTGMSERARLLGGEFRVRSTPGRGTTAVVEFSQKGVRSG